MGLARVGVELRRNLRNFSGEDHIAQEEGVMDSKTLLSYPDNHDNYLQ
jgi:hypothetical protein